MSKYFDKKETNFRVPEILEQGRHMIMTQVNPELKTKYVNIDTRFQEEYNTQKYADVTFKIEVNNVKSIKVTNVEIPVSFYPFSTRRKNTYFKIVDKADPARPVIIKINDRFYNQEHSIISAITEKLEFHDLSHIYFNIHNETNNNYGDINKVEFYNSSPTKTYTIHFNVDEHGNDDRNHFKSTLGWCLGFREPVYEMNPFTELVAEAMITIKPFRYLYIGVDDFHSNKQNSFIAPSVQSYMSSNILARVSLDPNTFSAGDFIVANQMTGYLLSETRIYSVKTALQNLRIQLLDEFGHVVDLNQMDFSFVLEIMYT